MNASDKNFSDLLALAKSWISWWSEPAHVSRDFWMPDESCRVCYECDSQFAVLNRRHHCRLCGRIFCGKCTSNWLPATSTVPRGSQQDWDKIRVCNYCFKQWKQSLAASIDDGNRVPCLDISISPSSTSLVSTKSSDTSDSSVTLSSVPQSVSSYRQNSALQSAVMESTVDRQDGTGSERINDPITGTVSRAPIPFRSNRSDDDSYTAYQLDSEIAHFRQVNGFHDQVQFYDYDYESCEVHPEREITGAKNMGIFSVDHSVDSQDLEAILQTVRKEDEHDSDEAPTSVEDVDAEPVDFENNDLLWLPPEPENEEDEREAFLFEDDDDVDAIGEWGSLRNSSNFGTGEYRNRDRSNEEHRKAMKNVVDGHFRALISQLLQVKNLPVGEEYGREGWLEIIKSLSWEAANVLKPDTSKSGGMDPGGYVKVKCVAAGCKYESVVIKGVVCKKNVAHRRMISRIEKPRMLILGGALEYQRVSNHLSSFDTLLQQEMDHLKMAVAKIDAHHPDVLLVEKSVSRYAQEYLLAKDISLVLNIKRPLLERISRCTGGQIVPSIDHLSSQKLGYCEMFHVEKFPEDHSAAGNGGKKPVKTLMYFEGCPKPLGCTILLRGASGDELKKVKHVVQYGVFAAYHLALETSFLADEGASLPELPLSAPINVTLPGKPSSIDRSISTVPGFVFPASEKVQSPQLFGEPHRFNNVPTSNLVSTSASGLKTDMDLLPNLPNILCSECMNLSSNFVNSIASVTTTASNQGIFHPHHYGSYLSYDASKEKSVISSKESLEGKSSSNNNSQDVMASNFTANSSLTSGAVIGVPIGSLQNDFKALVANRESPYLSASRSDGESISEEPVSSKEKFPLSPSDHQSILVSLSSRCVSKGTVCERSHLFRIKYYGNFDKPLGRFLQDHLFDQNYRCLSCEMPSEAHVHCYTHRQGTLKISVKKLADFLFPGQKERKIWMWHRCLRCPRDNGFPPATSRVVMSDAAWGLSFGKFLELSFSNHAAASRVASCGHSLHRDCLRFYGFGSMVACFRYASIDVHSVYLPPSKLDFNCENQEWIEKELNEVVGRAELLFSEVLNALGQIVEERSCMERVNNGLKSPESRRQVADLEEMLQTEKTEFEESLQKIVDKEAKMGQPVFDILKINSLRRQLLFQSYIWDNRLVYVASLDNNSIHSDLIGYSPEHMEKPTSDNIEFNGTCISSKSGIVPSTCDFVPVDTRTKESHDLEQETGNHDRPAIVHQGIDVRIDLTNGMEKQPNTSGVDIYDELDPSKSNEIDCKVLSDGEVPVMTSLSDTLNAVWTGKNHSGNGIMRDNTCALSESATVDSSKTTMVVEKSDLIDHDEDQSAAKVLHPPLLATKNSQNMEDSMSWLGMPFLNFYRSLNKNILGSAKKLDTLGDYNPVYVSSFRDSELQGGVRLLLPIGVNETVIPIYDDEPTSIIAYALVSPDYAVQLSEKIDRPKDSMESAIAFQSLEPSNFQSFQSFHSFDEMALESYKSHGFSDESILSMSISRSSLGADTLSYTKSSHDRVSFADDGPNGKVRYAVTCFYAKQFEALRKICCPSEMDFIRSLSRCKKWGAQGGKSNVFFAKTLDERFIIKQVTKTELESFIKFAPGYFEYLSDSIGTGSPTCLAKILGIYQVTSKHLKGGKESKMDLLVMENLLFGRNVTRLYDLKGSSRSRYNPDSSGSNTVLLDQNLIEAMPTSPIFVGNKAKRLLERAVWNDTAFLASIDVMDYSLLVGVDEEKHELVLGIIDFMRQYTLDKHLETWVKASGFLGGPKNVSPTVISPNRYKKRFRKAMTTYFLMIPDQWSPPDIIPSKSQAD